MLLSFTFVSISSRFFAQMMCLASEENSVNIQWNMMKEFGKIYDATYWVLHFEANTYSSWNELWHTVLNEEQNLGYFLATSPPSNNSKDTLRPTRLAKQSYGITIHLYTDYNLQPLKKFICNEMSTVSNSKISLNSPSDIWLLRIPEATGRLDGLDIFKTFQTGSNTKIFCYTVLENGDIAIDVMFKAHKNSDNILKPHSIWSPKSGFKNLYHNNWSKNQNLDGFHIRVVSAYHPPAVTFIQDGCTSKNCFKGLFADIWHTLSEQLNFTFTVRRVYQWGSLTNGTWNGMVGMLKEGNADIAVADLTITSVRSKVVDFLPAIVEVTEALYIKNPGDTFSSVSYMGPFTTTSWAVLAFWTICVPLFLVWIFGSVRYRNGEKLTLCDSYVFVAATMVNLGYTLKSNKTRNRVAIASVLIGGMLIYYHWEAQLTSHLASKKAILPFNNLEELSQSSKFKLLLSRGTSHWDYFKNSDDPVIKQIWREMVEPFLDQLSVTKHEKPKEQILKDPYAVAYSESSIKLTRAYIECNIVQIRPPIRKSLLAFATRKHFPYYQTFEDHINNLKVVGLVQKYIQSYQMEAQICKDYSGEPVPIQQCFSAFQILITGIIVASLGLTLEACVPLERMKIIFRSEKENGKKVTVMNERSPISQGHSKKQSLTPVKEAFHEQNDDDTTNHQRVIELKKIIQLLQEENNRLRSNIFEQNLN